MNVTQPEIEEMLRLLSDTPRRITAAAETLGDDRLHLKPDNKSWSAAYILAHLHACADVWGETIASMLQDNEPALSHVSPRIYLKKTDYLERPFHDLFGSFVDQRRELLQALYDLEFADWSRGAMIKDRRHTIFSQARRLALHESTHCEQLETVCRDLQTS